jgi:hypothetical protein
LRLFFKLVLLFVVVSVLGFVGWFVYSLLSVLGSLPSGYGFVIPCVLGLVGFKSDEQLRREAFEEHQSVLGEFEHDELLRGFDGDDEPDFEKGLSAHWRGFQRVGQGVVTNGVETGKKACGTYYGVDFCPNVHLHNFVSLDGVNYRGKTSWVKRFRSCDKPSCPVCYKRWAQRQARHVEARIKVLEKQLGKKAEHLVWSPKSDCYGLSFEDLKAMMRKELKACGYLGGYEIFHMERYANYYESCEKGVPCGWYISLHFHVIGFIDGDYDKCRKCRKAKSECLNCSGFDGRARRVHFGYVDRSGHKCEGSGSIIKVMDKRKTIWGTAYYQLNHSTIRVNGSRQNVGVWSGVAGKRKLKLKPEDLYRHTCPICQSLMVHGQYVGEGFVDGGDFSLREGISDFCDSRGVPQFFMVDKYE